jgi:hypothetical protein
MTGLAALVARYRSAAIYTPPFEPPASYWSPYERWGIYRYPFDIEREYWEPGRPLPSLFWPPAVFEQVRDVLAELLVASLRAATP